MGGGGLVVFFTSSSASWLIFLPDASPSALTPLEPFLYFCSSRASVRISLLEDARRHGCQRHRGGACATSVELVLLKRVTCDAATHRTPLSSSGSSSAAVTGARERTDLGLHRIGQGSQRSLQRCPAHCVTSDNGSRQSSWCARAAGQSRRRSYITMTTGEPPSPGWHSSAKKPVQLQSIGG